MSSANTKASSPRQEALDVVIVELERSLEVLKQNYQNAVSNLNQLRQCVDTDDLTRLLRRGAFMRKLHALLQISKAEGREVLLMMIDVDHFKKVNDGYGHQTGDVVLERVSELIRGFMRPEDLAGRYGGEEIIVAIQAGDAKAADVAENIRRAVESQRMKSTSHTEFTVTLSVGVASTHTFGFEADVLISKADGALYGAKRTGRNKVVSADVELTLLDAA
jgi:diguanylate cyclase (GGDEF)-like protein